MTNALSGTAEKTSESNEGFMTEDSDSVELERATTAAPSRSVQKDPAIRRKIEDRLERKRMREELGIYDDEAWADI
ncbi:MAG: hypothetical protein JWM78_746 [Verrucomicrobiaceae bacterium]|nr:hypothetical protein [Verrucomicrobiaceae bacterium]